MEFDACNVKSEHIDKLATKIAGLLDGDNPSQGDPENALRLAHAELKREDFFNLLDLVSQREKKGTGQDVSFDPNQRSADGLPKVDIVHNEKEITVPNVLKYPPTVNRGWTPGRMAKNTIKLDGEEIQESAQSVLSGLAEEVEPDLIMKRVFLGLTEADAAAVQREAERIQGENRTNNPGVTYADVPNFLCKK